VKRSIGGPIAIPLSPAVATEGLVFLSGQVPDDPTQSIEGQTRQVLDKIAALLAEAGSNLGQVVKTTVFLRDVDDFVGMNRAYAAYFPVDPPARSTVRVDLVVDARVEIEAIALRQGG